MSELNLTLQTDVPLPWQVAQWQRIQNQLQNSKLAHAYLLAGPAGLGKLMFAQNFARYMLCKEQTNGRSCGRCQGCLLAKHGHPDLLEIAVQEGSKEIKIAQIRELAEFVLLTSHAGGARIVIVDQAHAMNSSSANALLKTLEEPTRQTYLFLISDAPGALLPTIRSRCQRVQFMTPSLEQAATWLKGQLAAGADEDEVSLLAAAGNRPLLALELASSGAFEVRQEFVERACRLLVGEDSISQLVALAGKLGEKTAIGYLSETSTILIRYLLDDEQIPEQEIFLGKLAGILTSTETAAKPKAVSLLGFYEQAQLAQAQLSSGSNPNPQLIVESLLWRWRELPLGLSA